MPKSEAPIEVNGFAYREIRERSGLAIADAATQVGISRPYLARIENGGRVRVSPPVLAAMLATLQIRDRRAILANPHEPASDLTELDDLTPARSA